MVLSDGNQSAHAPLDRRDIVTRIDRASGEEMALAASPDEAPIIVDYRPTTGDYVKTAVASASRSVVMVAIGTSLVGIAIIPVLNGDLVSWLTLLLGLTFVSGLYVVPFIWWAVQRCPDLMLTSQRLTVDAWGVRTEMATVKTEQARPTFRRVREVRSGFVLDYGTGANAVIPKRAFDPATLVRFRELASGAGKLDRSPRWRPTVVGMVLGGGAALAFVLIVSATSTP
jgi:hypothetical protein